MGKLTVKDGKKVCTKCKVLKDTSSFILVLDNRFGKKYISSKCKECTKKATYVWRSKNPLKNKTIASNHRARLKKEVFC